MKGEYISPGIPKNIPVVQYNKSLFSSSASDFEI